MEKIYDVFISYRRGSGQDIARALQLGLENQGLRVFFDLEELRGGNFNEKLYIAIEQSKNVIFLLTEGACDRFENKNDWVRLELEHAVRKQINIVPVAPLGCPRSFPEKLPDSLEPLRALQIALLHTEDLFKESVKKIIAEYLQNIDLAETSEKDEAEKVFLEIVRNYKGNDGVIDEAEKKELISKAEEFKISPARREALILQVEKEFQTAVGLPVSPLSGGMPDSRQYDIFISYRRDGGAANARLMYERFSQDGYSVSFDMDTLKNGNFNEELLRRVVGCKNFIVLLSKDCFQKTLSGCKREDDWFRIEIATALFNKKNVISIMLPGFVFPEKLPPDIDAVRYKNGPKWDDFYLDSFFAKLKTDFLLGDRNESVGNAPELPETAEERKNDVPADESLEEILGDDAEYCRAEVEGAYRGISRIIPFDELIIIDETWSAAEYNLEQGDHKLASRLYMEVLKLSFGIKPSPLPFVTQLVSDGIDPHSGTWFEQAIQKANEGNADYQYGIGLLYSLGIGIEKDVSAAFRWFELASKQNHVKATAAVGAAYMSGSGIEKNYSVAFQYLEKAFEQEDASAAERLGFLCQHGFGLPEKDFRKALQYYQKAVEWGNSDAMVSLGRMIENGEGGTADLPQAISWYRSAAAKGNPAGQMKMAQFLFSGNGVERNYAEALKYARAAADGGNADGRALLGKAYEDGLGVPADKDKAEKLYYAALDAGSELAKAYLAELEAEVQYRNGMKCLEVELGKERDYAGARFWFEKSAAQGNAAAMEQLGYLCERGLGGEFDISAARSWYEKAAEKGNAAALAGLGSLYFQGDSGIEKDYSKAMDLMKKAAARLNSSEEESRWKVLNALYCIGNMYENGFGVDKDYSLALRFYLAGAHHGNLRCAFQLAQIYQKGRPGIPASPENSKRWFEFCGSYENKIHQEDDRAMRIIGHLYYFGNGGKPKDCEIADMWYEKSAKMGNILALYDLGGAYYKGEGVLKNINTALSYYLPAAERGYTTAQNHVSWIYYKGLGNIEKDFQKAYFWGKKAADGGSSAAMETLFRMYRDGDGVEKNSSEALNLLRKAAAKGNSAAMSSLGNCYERGELDLPVDLEKAIRYYKKSADKNDTHGLYELGRCYWEGIGVEKNNGLALKYLTEATQRIDYDLQFHQNAIKLLDKMFFDNNDFASNIAVYDKLEPKSCQTAVYKLGLAYRWGKTLTKDMQRALICYTAAAERDNSSAQNGLGWLFYVGIEIEQDLKKAFEWTMKAVQNGNPYGMETLFRMYRDGDGVKQDLHEALLWLQRASDLTQGNSSPCALSEMGECYENGLYGIEKNEKTAFTYYSAAAKRTKCPGKYNLGRCYLRGIGTEKNVDLGIRWLIEASKIEDTDDHIYQERAMRHLSEVYRTGECGEVSEEKANEWLKKADELKKRSESLKKGTK